MQNLINDKRNQLKALQNIIEGHSNKNELGMAQETTKNQEY